MTAIVSFLGGMFRGPNAQWDFGRAAGFFVITSYNAGWLYALIRLHSIPDWTNLGTGEGLMLAGVVALIAGKDIAVAKANATTAASQ
jgi:hypothetical protein